MEWTGTGLLVLSDPIRSRFNVRRRVDSFGAMAAELPWRGWELAEASALGLLKTLAALVKVEGGVRDNAVGGNKVN
jgi:hypothetical protein